VATHGVCAETFFWSEPADALPWLRHLILPANQTAMNTAASRTGTSSPNRRDFLKTSATVAGTALLGALERGALRARRGEQHAQARPHRLRRTRHGAAGDALKGDAGTTLWAAADLFPETGPGVAQDAEPDVPESDPGAAGPTVHGTERVSRCDRNCDVVLIACASRFHGNMRWRRCRRRSTCFVEKPAAVDVAGIEKIPAGRCALEAKRHGSPGGGDLSYHLGRREAVRRMQAGEIGDIVAIQCEYLRDPTG